MTNAKQRKLPNMNEFSPGQACGLRRLLSLALDLEGNREAQVKAVVDASPKIAKTQNSTQRLGRARNVLIGMSQCGLYDLDANRLTDLGRELAGLQSSEALHGRFSRHLLLECHGLDLLDVVQVIRARGDKVTLQAIREELRSRGFAVTENEGNASKIRKWLEKSGVVDNEWNFSGSRLSDLLGVDSEGLAEWRSLQRPQRILLQKIRAASLVRGESVDLAPLKRLAEIEWGRYLFPEGSFRAKVVEPLEAGGWIIASGKGPGRGGNIGRATALDKLLSLKIDLPVESHTAIPADIRPKLATPIEDVFSDLGSSDTHVKGVALEILALRLARDLGLYAAALRLRGKETGGAEVDVIADGVHLHYSRWLLQCKNVNRVSVSSIAKEVGMAVVLKAHVIAMVTTGGFSRDVESFADSDSEAPNIWGDVESFADSVSESSPLQVVLIPGPLLELYRQHGVGHVINSLKEQSRRILDLKRGQIARSANSG